MNFNVYISILLQTLLFNFWVFEKNLMKTV